MNVELYEGTPDDRALEISRAPDWAGPFDSLAFPSPAAREDARAALERDGRTWLDRATLAVVVAP